MRPPTQQPEFAEGDYVMLAIDATPRPGRIRLITQTGRYVVDLAGERIPITVPSHNLRPLDPEGEPLETIPG